MGVSDGITTRTVEVICANIRTMTKDGHIKLAKRDLSPTSTIQFC